MYKSHLISIIAIAFVVSQVQRGTWVRAMPAAPPEPLTRAQIDLVRGVYRERHWYNLWFNSVKHRENWTAVDALLSRRSRPGSWKKLHMIPRMMGCKYGVQFVWFLTLAVSAVGVCNGLSLRQDGNTGDCWCKLVQGLQEGSYAILLVKTALRYVHSTIGDDVDSDVFYRVVSTVRDFLNQRGLSEITVPLSESLEYVQLMAGHIVSLGTYLNSYCRPEHPLLDMNQFAYRLPGDQVYRLYVDEMKSHVEDVVAHLLAMGFGLEI